MNNEAHYEYRAEFYDQVGPISHWRPVCRDMVTKGWTASEESARAEREQARADRLKTRLIRRLIAYPEIVEVGP